MKTLTLLLIALAFAYANHHTYVGLYLDIGDDYGDGPDDDVASCPLANGTTEGDPTTVLPHHYLATGDCFPFWSTYDRSPSFYMINGSSAGWDGKFLCDGTCTVCGFQFSGLKKLGTSGKTCEKKNFTFATFNLTGAAAVTAEDVSYANVLTAVETPGKSVFAGFNASDTHCAGEATFFRHRTGGDCFPGLPSANNSVALYCVNASMSPLPFPLTAKLDGTLTCAGSTTATPGVPDPSKTDGTAIGARGCFAQQGPTCLTGPGSTAYCGSAKLLSSACATTTAATTTAAGGGTTTTASGASSLAVSGLTLLFGLLALLY